MAASSPTAVQRSLQAIPPAVEGPLYASPIGLFEFQSLGVARTYWQFAETQEPAAFVLWDTGIGKTHLAMATAALMVEDGLLDRIIIVAEANKVSDWADDDFPAFTKLITKKYVGTPDRRKRILADPPQVLVMTYEMGRNDICTFKTRSRAVTGNGPLTEFLRGQRTLIVFDEVTKLRNRTSMLYTAWDYLINRVLRKEGTYVAVAGMTATSVENNPEDHYNAGRILAPWLAPSVAEFERTYIQSYDIHGNPDRYWNLRRDNTLHPGVTPLSEMFARITLRKRKTDPDVIEQFPRKIENPPRFVELTAQHRLFYDAIEESLASEDMLEQRRLVGVLRQFAGHPAALLRSHGSMARSIVDIIGRDRLATVGAAKVEEMLAWCRRMAEQQMVIFTFYGQSMLPLLHEELLHEGYRVSINHGRMDAVERKVSQDRFKAGDTQIFLSSDAGARGLNLGCGSALLHYELPLLHSVFVQRSDRIHRIDSDHLSVTIDSLVTNATIEERLAKTLIKRNAWADAVLDDLAYDEDFDPGEQYLTADDRRLMLATSKRAVPR